MRAGRLRRNRADSRAKSVKRQPSHHRDCAPASLQPDRRSRGGALRTGAGMIAASNGCTCPRLPIAPVRRARLAGKASPAAHRGHRRRGLASARPWFVELGEVGGQGRILQRPAIEPSAELPHGAVLESAPGRAVAVWTISAARRRLAASRTAASPGGLRTASRCRAAAGPAQAREVWPLQPRAPIMPDSAAGWSPQPRAPRPRARREL